MKRAYSWGSYKGAKQHLFTDEIGSESLCGKAYSGDLGVFRASKRKKCALCEKLDAETR